MPSGVALVVLSAVAGAVHVLAPDHWFPASLLTWRRGWSTRAAAGFTALVLAAHVALGLALYFGFHAFFQAVVSARLFAFTLALVCIVGLIRAFRFSRVEEVFRARTQGRWQLWTILALLGPCESIIPILIKARQMGQGYALVTLSFFLGTVITGLALVLLGRLVWNRPELLARWGAVARRRVGPIPVAGMVAVGLVFLLRLS